MRRTTYLMLSAAVGLGLLTALPATAEAGGVIRVGMAASDAGRLDPHLSATTVDKAVFGWMFNGLVRFAPGTASPEYIEPDLAESWEHNDDGTVWTFNLREGVQCHHGYGELTAEDVVYSLERAGDPNRSSFSSDYAAFELVEAVDPYTVQITLAHPIPSVLGLVANYHGGNIVCKAAAEEMGEAFMQRPVGTGPFMFDEYRAQQSLNLVANPDYFRGAPQIEGILYRYIPSDSSRDLAFQSREIDVIYGRQDQTWVERTQQMDGVVVEVMEPAEMSVMYLNTKSPPLDDVRVRRAMAHALDREEMLQFKGPDVTRDAWSIVPGGYLGFVSFEDEIPEFDLDKARALLAEAGHPDGITLKVVHTALPGMLATIEVFQAQMARAGINLEIDVVEHATFHQQIRQDLSQVVHYSAARFPVADTYLTQFWHGDSIVGKPTAVTNFTHCDMADAQIEAARVETDPAQQLALWEEAQRILLIDEMCAVPVFENLQVWARHDYVDYGYDLHGSLTLGPIINETTTLNN